MKQIKKNNLEQAYDLMSQNAELFLPMQHNRQSGFFSWKQRATDDQVLLEDLNTYLPAKTILIPADEKLYKIHQQKNQVDVEPIFDKMGTSIIFGARSCDVEAIRCLDEVFLTRTYVDTPYQMRRNDNTIVANACYQPGPNCFCQDMGIEPSSGSIADVVIKDLGDRYLWESRTEKGEALSSLLGGLLENATETAEPSVQAFTTRADFAGLPEQLPPMFEHDIWQEVGEPCSNCGICTFVCPSCYCFDIQVKMWGDEGYRFRCHDSCMFGEYSLMAGGHNPRPTGIERFRNRYLHKIEFFNERYGHPLCTGCGRCIVQCPNGINIAQIINQLKEAAANE